MKKKKFNRKLVLNKKTVAQLNVEELNNLKGGTGEVTPGTCYCPSIIFCKDTGEGESVCICS